MALQPFDLVANAALDLDGNGRILQTDSLLTYVGRESGKVDLYTTEHVAENATLKQTDAAKAQQSSEQERIAQLEAELAQQPQKSSESPEQQRIAELEAALEASRAGNSGSTPEANL